MNSSRIPSPPPSIEEIDSHEKAALAAIEQVGPRNFRVTGLPLGEPLYFFALGCQGEEGERQKSVARKMNEHAETKRPAFLLFLGDNLYKGAPVSLQDPRFTSVYHDVYSLSHLQSIPGILVLGNHDANLENFTHHPNKFFTMPLVNWVVSPYRTGKDVEKYEIGHTYLHTKPEFYQQETLRINELPKWGMPYYFCSYEFIEANTQLFCLNSNTFVSDCIQHWISTASTNDTHSLPINQTEWFKREFEAATAAKRATIVAMHNPSLTSTKRSLPHKYDAHLYLLPKQIQQMNYLLKQMAADTCSAELVKTIFDETDININAAVANEEKNGSYAAMQHACFHLLNIRPNVQLHAHDHALVYNRTPDLCQIISGAGGSKDLMSKMTHANDSTMGCFLNEPGFVAVTCDAHGARPIITSEFYTTKGHYRQFTNTSHEATVSRDPDNTATELTPSTSMITAAAAILPRSLPF